MNRFRNDIQKHTQWILLAGTFISSASILVVRVQPYLTAGIILTIALVCALAYEHKLARIQAQTLFENTVDGIITLDGQSIIRAFNPAAEKMFGYRAEEVVGKNVTQLMPDEFIEKHKNALSRYLRTSEKRIIGTLVEVTGLKSDGKEFPIELGIAEFKLGGNQLFSGNIRDITERKKIEKELETLSQTDGLTGIYNRRSFDLILEKEWNRASRDMQPLSLILIDIDFFKKYNDTYGHVQGDECLKTVARGLCDSLNRAGDFVARYGGEEFVAVLPTTDSEHARKITEMIRHTVLDLQIAHSENDVSPHLTISLGVATIKKTRNRQSASLVEAADKALYEAKQNGRNQTVSTLI